MISTNSQTCWPRDYRKLLRRLVSVPAVLIRRGIPSGAALIRSLQSQKTQARPSWFARTLVTLPHDPFDAIVCHFGPRALECLHLRDIGAIKGPLYTVFHGYDLSRHLKQYGRNVYEELFQRGDLMLPVSEFWKQRLIELGCDPQKIRVHHMGVDCSKYALQLRKVAAGEPIRIVSIARMVEKKGA